jgi:tetratricopeptide (TPR) repeat protein
VSSIAPDDLAGLVRAVLTASADADLDPVCIRDALWLAAAMDAPGLSEDELAEEDPRAPGYRRPRRRVGRLKPDGTMISAEENAPERAGERGPDATEVFDDYNVGSPFGAGGVLARRVTLGGPGTLSGKLELARALRPFRQRFPSRHRMTLDVEATVRATAETRQMLPILRPGTERRFSADLVFDSSPSMLVWEDAFTELVSVFEHVGAFRDVKHWHLHVADDDVWLTDRSGQRWGPSALSGADRRRIVVIVTDAVADHWYRPAIWRHLIGWGSGGAVALMDLLPLKLWSFSGVGPNRIRVRATSAAAANAELKYNVPRRWRLAGRSATSAVAFPVVQLSPSALAEWSGMVAAAHAAGNAALLVESDPPYGMTEPPPRSDGKVSLKNFYHTASPVTLRLAVLAATSDSTTLAVLRAIQQELLPESSIGDLAEVLVSGIYRHVPDSQAYGLRIRMDPDCRAELQGLASPQDRWDVYRAISTVIQRESPDAAGSFLAAVHDSSGEISVPEGLAAFAEMARTALAQVRTVSAPEHAEAVAQEEPPLISEEPLSGEPPPTRGLPLFSTSEPPQDTVDFYISYVQSDRAWAEWIAWNLEEEGYRVIIQAWDFVPGSNWIQATRDGVSRAGRMIVVLSPAYLESEYGRAEWQATFAADPSGTSRRLLIVRVRESDRPGLLAGIVGVDLFGITEAEAKARLRAMVSSAASGRAKPQQTPQFPGARTAFDEVRFPGSQKLPRIWNVPARNPNFLGRDGELAALAAALSGGATAVVQSVRGMGGVGKTQLAIEFAHAHASDYELVYWIAADESATIADQFAGLARALGLEPAPDSDALRAQVHDLLRSVRGWLLIFDGADSADDVRPWLPSGVMPPGVPCHVIITTRRGGFSVFGRVLDLDVLDPSDAERLLRTRAPDLSEEIAQQIAAELGRLPLALEQAAAYLDRTGMPGRDYLELLRRRAADLYARGQVSGRRDTIATLWSLSVDRISNESPAAVQLLSICAYLAPEPIPLDLFTAHFSLLPEPLSSAAGDPLAFTDAVAVLADYSLATRTRSGLQVHPLIQATTRGRLPTGGFERSAATETSEAPAARPEPHPLAVTLGLLRADAPEQIVSAPQAWIRWRELLPHVLAATGHVAAASPAEPPTQADASSLLDSAATYLRVQGRPDEARPLVERAIAMDEAVHGPDHPDVAARLGNLALIDRDLGELGAARRYAERALTIHEAAYGPDHPAVAADLSTLALVLQDLGQSEAAQPLAERALVIDEAAYGPDHPEIATSLNNLAQIARDLGEPERARPLAERALAIDEAAYGPDHPDVAADLSTLALVLRDLGKPEAARPLAERALAIDEAAYGPDHPDIAARLNNLALILKDLGQPDAARPLIEQALRIDEVAYGPSHPDTLTTRDNLASSRGEAGDVAAARDLYAALLSDRERVLGPDHPDTLATRGNLAHWSGEAGDVAAARDLYAALLSDRERVLGPDHPDTLATRSNLAYWTTQAGDL